MKAHLKVISIPKFCTKFFNYITNVALFFWVSNSNTDLLIKEPWFIYSAATKESKKNLSDLFAAELKTKLVFLFLFYFKCIILFSLVFRKLLGDLMVENFNLLPDKINSLIIVMIIFILSF